MTANRTGRKKFDVFVGIDTADGRPFPWTAAFMRRDCRLYIQEWLGDEVAAARVPILRATLLIPAPKAKRRAK